MDGGGDLPDPYPLLHEGHPHSLAPRAHPYLLVDVCQVALDRRLREVKLGGYLQVGEATGDQNQHLGLPLRESAHRLLPEPLQQAPRHADHHVALARLATSMVARARGPRPFLLPSTLNRLPLPPLVFLGKVAQTREGEMVGEYQRILSGGPI